MNYLTITMPLIILVICYILVSSVVYAFHLSVVKEFYKIVAIIVEAHSQHKTNRYDIEIGLGIPEVCIGVPLFEHVEANSQGNE